jgi:hypothetical protein
MNDDEGWLRAPGFVTDRVLSPGSPIGCSPNGPCDGPRLRARWGAPPGATREVTKLARGHAADGAQLTRPLTTPNRDLEAAGLDPEALTPLRTRRHRLEFLVDSGLGQVQGIGDRGQRLEND